MEGCLLGTAVGDSLGLPYEGLTPARQRAMFADVDRQRFLFGHGMVSDDTDHACFVAQALLESNGDADEFERQLAWHLRLWLAGAPAGVGLATLRSTMKLGVGVPPSRSGVWSAGNGPAMRSALIGLYAADSPEVLCELVHRSTRITHSDPRAEVGALAVPVAAGVAARAANDSRDENLAASFRAEFDAAWQVWRTLPPHWKSEEAKAAVKEFWPLVRKAAASAAKGESALKFAQGNLVPRSGNFRGVSGYVYHTVPAVLQTWLRYPDDFRPAIVDIIRAGGDTDSTAAILGALIGARVGVDGIPKPWLDSIWEWPRSTSWMRMLAVALASRSRSIVPYPTWQVPLRNVIFTTAVLGHAFRRALPPY